ncbi:hypothetical protein C8R45DRAFT_1082060 [Mycena sanguinolenta]|nr:hypothetical protein C8R45DRAFT_1082060 [Mycena sanguinolenta]
MHASRAQDCHSIQGGLCYTGVGATPTRIDGTEANIVSWVRCAVFVEVAQSSYATSNQRQFRGSSAFEFSVPARSRLLGGLPRDIHEDSPAQPNSRLNLVASYGAKQSAQNISVGVVCWPRSDPQLLTSSTSAAETLKLHGGRKSIAIRCLRDAWDPISKLNPSSFGMRLLVWDLSGIHEQYSLCFSQDLELPTVHRTAASSVLSKSVTALAPHDQLLLRPPIPSVHLNPNDRWPNTNKELALASRASDDKLACT